MSFSALARESSCQTEGRWLETSDVARLAAQVLSLRRIVAIQAPELSPLVEDLLLASLPRLSMALEPRCQPEALDRRIQQLLLLPCERLRTAVGLLGPLEQRTLAKRLRHHGKTTATQGRSSDATSCLRAELARALRLHRRALRRRLGRDRPDLLPALQTPGSSP